MVTPLGGLLRGRAWVYGDDVDTDLLFSGRHTYTLRDPAEIAARALEDLDPAFAAAVRPGDVVVGGRNWGCGSSREQAVLALLYNGVAAVVAASFGRIFYRNAIHHGLPPIECPAAARVITAGEPVTVDLAAGRVRCAAGVFAFAPFAPTPAAILTAGGLVPYLRRRLGTAGPSLSSDDRPTIPGG